MSSKNVLKKPNARWIPWGISGGVVLLYSLLFYRQASDLYVIDEAEFPLVSRGVAMLGRPEYYRGDLLPENLGIWHPPLYQYTLGIWEQFFGSSHVAVRSFGFVCTIAAAVLGVFLLRRLFPRSFPWLSAAWLAAFLLHPLAIQGSLLPDIDTTVLVPITMAMVWLAGEVVVGKRWTLPTYSTITGLILGIAFLAKLTRPVALVPVALFILLRRARSWRAALAGVGLSVSVAIATYFIVWGGISRLIDVPFNYPVEFTRSSAASKDSGQSLADRIPLLWPSDYVQFWLLPAVLVAFVVAACAVAWQLRRAEAQVLACAAFIAIAVFAVYNVITGAPFGFPKYYAPIVGVGLLVIVGAFGLFERVMIPAIRPLGRGWRLGVLVAALVLLTSLSYVQFARAARFFALPIRPVLFVVATTAALSVLVFVLCLRHQRETSPPRLLVISLALGFFLSTVGAATSVALYQADSDRSVRYYPGERDLRDTVFEIRRRVIDAVPGVSEKPAHLIAAKDIGFESGLPYFEDASLLPAPMELERVLRSRRPLFLVSRRDYDYGEQSWPDAFRIISKHMKPVWTSPNGNFRIWQTQDQMRAP